MNAIEPEVKRKRGRPRKVVMAKLDPLEYCLRVLADPSVGDVRKDRIARLVLPYCHAKVYVLKPESGKQKAAKAATLAASGNGWDDDLRV
jgi:hypothetical protein